MQVDVKVKIVPKKFRVTKQNTITGELDFMQDFDTEAEAKARAFKVTEGLRVGVWSEILGIGSDDIGMSIDTQVDEVEWERLQAKKMGGGLITPKGLKV